MQRADKRKFHYIYKITRDDGRYYIGMHSTDNLDDGYFGSGKRITRSIKKHGRERHRKEILEFLPSRFELREREAQLVNEELISDPMCMNIAPGGNGGCSKETQFIWSSAGGKASAEKRRFNESFRLQVSSKRKSTLKIVMNSDEVKKNLKPHLGFVGKKHSEETKKKWKISRAGKQDGEKNSQFGTCWVTDGEKPIKIRKEQIDEYFSKGYRHGRK